MNNTKMRLEFVADARAAGKFVQPVQRSDISASKLCERSPFLTTKQAAHYLCLSSQTLEKMRVYANGPRFRKHGRYVRYHIDDLNNWSEMRGHFSTSDEGVKN